VEQRSCHEAAGQLLQRRLYLQDCASTANAIESQSDTCNDSTATRPNTSSEYDTDTRIDATASFTDASA